jgi:tetratricopeptide (TPR) repeat protein
LEKAAEYFRQAVEVNPADYKNYEKAAIAYGLLGESQVAYDWYVKAVERYPGCGRLHLRLGELAERLGKPEEALLHYQQAVAIEDAFRQQFREMYPEREKVVSRLGGDNYQRAKERVGVLSQ